MPNGASGTQYHRPKARRQLKEPQSIKVEFRVTEGEYEAIRRAQRKSNHLTVSAYLRSVVLGTKEETF